MSVLWRIVSPSFTLPFSLLLSVLVFPLSPYLSPYLCPCQVLKRELQYQSKVYVLCPSSCMNKAKAMAVVGTKCAFSVYSDVCMAAIYAGVYVPGLQPGNHFVELDYAGVFLRFEGSQGESGVTSIPWKYPDLAFRIGGKTPSFCPRRD